MDKLQVCNLAIAAMGSGRRLDTLTEATPEAEACTLNFQMALDLCLDRNNWSFARRDEIITPKELYGGEGMAVPYLYVYKIPKDTARVLYLKPMGSSSIDETGGATRGIDFNFRNIDDVRYIACDYPAPFEIHYQAKINDLNVCTPSFIYALSLQLAILIAPSVIGGSEGFKIIEVLNKQFEQAIIRAAAVDAQQGSYALSSNKRISFVECRQ